jgi:signal transduction histidine kinase/ligand-binding sensor domain-containing protein
VLSAFSSSSTHGLAFVEGYNPLRNTVPLPFRRRLAGRHRAVLLIASLLAVSWQDVGAERLPTRTYSTADGLANNRIDRIVRDSEGFIWFCTPDGLSRFDGYAFRTISTAHGLPSAGITDLLETTTGDFWVATERGLVHLDRTSREAVRESRPVAINQPLPLIVAADDDPRSSGIRVLRQVADGTIWVGTRNGLFRLDTGSQPASLHPVEIGLRHNLAEHRFITDLLEDRHGTLWIATVRGLHRRWPDGSVEHYYAPEDIPFGDVSDVFEDHDGRVWIGTRNGGFFRLRTDGSHAPPIADQAFTGSDGLRDYKVTRLFESSDRRFWIATAQGLAELLPSVAGARRVLRMYTSREGLDSEYLGSIGEDLAGNVWIGTGGNGAIKLSREGFTTFGTHDGIREVNAIFEDRDGNTCFRGTVLTDGKKSVFEGGTLDLVSVREPGWVDSFGCFDGQKFSWFKPDALLKWGWARTGNTLQARNGEWWIGSLDAVLRFPATNRFPDLKAASLLASYTPRDGLHSDVNRLFEDSHGDVWISSGSYAGSGLARYERRTGRLHEIGRLPGLPSPAHDFARAFIEDPQGNVWISFAAGLARYSEGAVTFFTPREGLPPGRIENMHIDRVGRLWLASMGGGLVRVDDALSLTPTFVAFTTANGLASNELVVITEDRDGHLYVGRGHGIDRFDPATGRVRHFSHADGLVSGLLTHAYKDRRGVLWFGATSGLAKLVPQHATPARPPPILISGLRVGGTEYLISPFGNRHVSLADLLPRERQIEVEFVGLGFAPGEVLRYQYRLEGGDSQWSAPSPRRTVTFASLSPGRYVLSVQALNADGLSSPSPATLTFTIPRPVWQRWWFLTMAATALVVAIARFWRYRVARLLEMANMRTHIATDLHDDIGANLTRIALLSETAQRTQEETALASIAAIARESVSSMSDIVWAINPRRETLLDLTRRMRQHADELFTLRGITLRFQAPGSGETRRLGVDVRRDLLLIFKEAVNNAARHSGCTAVAISIVADHNTLKLTIKDDGVGFDPWTEVEGHGLASMRRRAERIRGVLRIRGAAGSGTLLTLEVPL